MKWIVFALVGIVLILIVGRWLARRKFDPEPHVTTRFSRAAKWTYCAAFLVIAVGTGGIIWWPTGTKGDRPALEAVEPLLTVRGDPDKPGSRASLAFRIQNRSSQAVKIGNVSTSCSCLVPAGLAGKTMAPGQEITLDAEVGVPELGATTQRLMVFHDGPGSPLALSVKAQGRRQLPVIDAVENGFPMFDNLTEAGAGQTMVVKTFEEIGAKPWLGELSTDHPSVKITRGNVSEAIEERGGFVRRTYEYAVGWNDIPAQREVRSPIYAKTPIDPDPGVFIGSVAALVKQSPFSPTTVHFQRGNVDEDWIVFSGIHDKSQPWKISEDTELPGWLATQWQEADGRLLLRLSLTDDFHGTEPLRFQIQLVKGDGSAETLAVVAYPSM